MNFTLVYRYYFWITNKKKLRILTNFYFYRNVNYRNKTKYIQLLYTLNAYYNFLKNLQYCKIKIYNFPTREKKTQTVSTVIYFFETFYTFFKRYN